MSEENKPTLNIPELTKQIRLAYDSLRENGLNGVYDGMYWCAKKRVADAILRLNTAIMYACGCDGAAEKNNERLSQPAVYRELENGDVVRVANNDQVMFNERPHTALVEKNGGIVINVVDNETGDCNIAPICDLIPIVDCEGLTETARRSIIV